MPSHLSLPWPLVWRYVVPLVVLQVIAATAGTLVSKHRPVVLVVLHVSIALAMTMGALLIGRGTDRTQRSALRVLALAAPGSFAVLAWLTGGTMGPLFPSLAVISVVASYVIRFDRVAMFTAIVISLGTGCWLYLSEHRAPALLVAWLATTLTGLVFVHFSHRMAKLEAEGRVKEVEATAERDRALGIEQRMAAIGRLAAGAAHEVANPLAFVKSNFEALARNDPLDPKERAELVSDTRDGLERIQHLITDMQHFSRVEIEPASWIDVRRCLEDGVRIAEVRRKHGQTVRIDCAPDLPQVKVHPRRLVQVIINLVTNAFDATETRPDGEVVVEARAEGRRVVIRVLDNGIGLSNTVLSHLFEPFFTTKPAGRGTGLGLPLSKELVTRYGGTIDGDNLETGGACFTVRLPPPPGDQR